MGIVVPNQLGEAKICNFRHEVSVEKYVTALNVSVDDIGPNFLVEISKPSGYTY